MAERGRARGADGKYVKSGRWVREVSSAELARLVVEKPRSDAMLKTLPAEMQAKIVEHGVGHSTRATAEWLSKQGIETTCTTVGLFLRWHRAKEEFARRESLVLGMLESMKRRDPSLTPQRLREVGQTLFSELAMEGKDARMWSLVQQIALREEKLRLDWEKLREEMKARKAEIEREVNQAKSAGGISSETLEKIEGELRLL